MLRGVWTVLLAMILPGLPSAAQVELVSSADPDNLSITPEGASTFSSFSADGRYTVFVSDALNVLPGQRDANGKTDVFLNDQVTGTTVLVSFAGDSDSLVTANAESGSGWISADGRYVLFASKATNVISGQIDSPGSTDLFLYDRITRTKVLVSRSSQSEKRTGNAGSRSWFPVISADGRYVAFASEATDLVKDQEDSNSGEDLFLYDRALRKTTLVSRSAGFPAKAGNRHLGDTSPAISADGSQILFSSDATDLLPGGTSGGGEQLFLFNRLSGIVTLVSHAAGSPSTGTTVGFNGASLSSDGNYAAFYSTGGLYLYERASGAVTLVAEGISGQPPRLNANGRYVAFLSSSLVPGEAHHGQDVFLYDRVSKTIDLASRSYTTTSNIQGQTGSLSISADGRFVAFSSELQDLVPGQNDPLYYTPDVFVYDRVSRKTRLVSHRSGSSMDAAGGSGGLLAFSADSRSFGFTSSSGKLAEGRDFNRAADAFHYDLRTDATTTVSLRQGSPSLGAGSTKLTAVSADGRYVLFQSQAPNVVPNQQDANDREYPYSPGSDVFLYDRVTRTKTLVSRSAASPTTTGNNSSGGGGLSPDGRYVLFLSYATDLVPGQVNVHAGVNVFLFDRITGTTTLVSHSAASPTTTSNSECFDTGPISSDNRYLVLTCFSTDLVPGQNDTNERSDTFLYDRVLNSSLLVSRAAGSVATSADGRSDDLAMSADGRFVAFRSFASNLVPGQDASIPFPENVFLFDRVSGTTALVSHALSDPVQPGDLYSSNPVISADGRFVAFTSYATDLVLPPGFPGPSSNEPLYLFDRTSGAISRVTTDGENAVLSADGRFMVFGSKVQSLVPGQIDPNGFTYDIFLYDRVSGTTELVSRRSGSTATTGNGPSGPTASLSADGNVVAFFSSATDLIPGQVSPQGIYLYDRTTRTLELAGAASFSHVLSANGRYVAFERKGVSSEADNNSKTSVDIYLYAKGSSTAGPTSLPACTLLDTRRRADRPALASNVQRTVAVRGACGVPATAKQVVVKVTVSSPSGKGNLRFYPGAVTAAPSGILRFERNATRTETFTLPLGTNGTLTILPFVTGRGTVHVAVEVTGYAD